MRCAATLLVTESILYLVLNLLDVDERFADALSVPIVRFSLSSAVHGIAAAVLLVVNIVGLLVAASFYAHNARVVFNCQPRPIWSDPVPFLRMLPLLRPLGIVWRFATAPLRTLPDVYLVGETRCGTTTLSKHLRERLSIHGPFSPWDFDFANGKESFYFVGHYWGSVDPQWYRMAFPLKITRWFHEKVLRQKFVVYDGCASYLSAPWTARAIHEATPHAKIIVCLREPVRAPH